MMTRCHCRYASWEVVRRGAPAVLYTLGFGLLFSRCPWLAGGPTWLDGWLLVLPLRCAAVGSVHHVPATTVGVRVLVHNGALLRVSCTTPFGTCFSWSAPSGSPRSFGTSVGKVRLRHLRKNEIKRLRVLGIGISKGWVKIDTASGNSKKMHTSRLADKETLVGTSDDHGVIAGALSPPGDLSSGCS